MVLIESERLKDYIKQQRAALDNDYGDNLMREVEDYITVLEIFTRKQARMKEDPRETPGRVYKSHNPAERAREQKKRDKEALENAGV